MSSRFRNRSAGVQSKPHVCISRPPGDPGPPMIGLSAVVRAFVSGTRFGTSGSAAGVVQMRRATEIDTFVGSINPDDLWRINVVLNPVPISGGPLIRLDLVYQGDPVPALIVRLSQIITAYPGGRVAEYTVNQWTTEVGQGGGYAVAWIG